MKKFIYGLIAVLSLIYSMAVFMVGSGTFSFVIWILVAVFLVFLLFMECRDRWNRVPKFIRNIFRTIIGIVIIVFIICQGCIMTQFFSKGEAGADYI